MDGWKDGWLEGKKERNRCMGGGREGSDAIIRNTQRQREGGDIGGTPLSWVCSFNIVRGGVLPLWSQNISHAPVCWAEPVVVDKDYNWSYKL